MANEKVQPKHKAGCWKDITHHDCAVALVEELLGALRKYANVRDGFGNYSADELLKEGEK